MIQCSTPDEPWGDGIALIRQEDRFDSDIGYLGTYGLDLKIQYRRAGYKHNEASK